MVGPAGSLATNEAASGLNFRRERNDDACRLLAWPHAVPAGNRNAEQPGGSRARSASRTKALKTSYEAKYRKVIALLRNDKALRTKIVATVSSQYGISPLHIAGAIVGEHTYNVDAYDRLQTILRQGRILSRLKLPLRI
jgi:hypothetical protein